jgi:hypothetical protein
MAAKTKCKESKATGDVELKEYQSQENTGIAERKDKLKRMQSGKIPKI